MDLEQKIHAEKTSSQEKDFEIQRLQSELKQNMDLAAHREQILQAKLDEQFGQVRMQTTEVQRVNLEMKRMQGTIDELRVVIRQE